MIVHLQQQQQVKKKNSLFSQNRKCFFSKTASDLLLIHGMGEISGSHGSKYEDNCLLGCCTMQSQKFTDV
jgi:hypothetical protein